MSDGGSDRGRLYFMKVRTTSFREGIDDVVERINMFLNKEHPKWEEVKEKGRGLVIGSGRSRINATEDDLGTFDDYDDDFDEEDFEDKVSSMLQGVTGTATEVKEDDDLDEDVDLREDKDWFAEVINIGEDNPNIHEEGFVGLVTDAFDDVRSILLDEDEVRAIDDRPHTEFSLEKFKEGDISFDDLVEHSRKDIVENKVGEEVMVNTRNMGRVKAKLLGYNDNNNKCEIKIDRSGLEIEKEVEYERLDI